MPPTLRVLSSDPDEPLEVVLRPEPVPDVSYWRIVLGEAWGAFVVALEPTRTAGPGDVEVIRDPDGAVRVRVV